MILAWEDRLDRFPEGLWIAVYVLLQHYFVVAPLFKLNLAGYAISSSAIGTPVQFVV